ncbi:uncharacterized protein LOC123683862 [Harmonia axyridis]|uniref:uncharacterized protein LOC123683862 n=1 Tax=Harmonia axyridis TaxID=115357 RepID=UPI001E275BF3|nr:uncharacterized protein LOC123683862 [Harmonia axyridis]XP_045478779.1 uncharacterized protein LOC123683862 [Harmonia axyridis]
MSTEITKMKQGMSYSCKEKTIILNVFKYFKGQFPDKCVTDLVRRTAKATGCSEKSIFQFRKEEASAEGFKAPSKTKIRKNININSRDIKYDDSVRQSIRNIIYDLKYRNVVPSLNTILKNVHLNKQLPNFSLMTLRRLLFDMGFSYEKVGNKSILIEKKESSTETGKGKKDKTKPSDTPHLGVLETPRISDSNISPQSIIQSSVTLLPKPTPQHFVAHMNSNINLHLSHLQSVDHQSPYHSLKPMPGPFQTHSHPMMGSTVHEQHPVTHNMPPVVLDQRSHQHPSHLIPQPFNMHLKREEFVQGI